MGVTSNSDSSFTDIDTTPLKHIKCSTDRYPGPYAESHKGGYTTLTRVYEVREAPPGKFWCSEILSGAI